MRSSGTNSSSEPSRPAALAFVQAEDGREDHPHGDPLHPLAGIQGLAGLQVGQHLGAEPLDQGAVGLEAPA